MKSDPKYDFRERMNFYGQKMKGVMQWVTEYLLGLHQAVVHLRFKCLELYQGLNI